MLFSLFGHITITDNVRVFKLKCNKIQILNGQNGSGLIEIIFSFGFVPKRGLVRDSPVTDA